MTRIDPLSVKGTNAVSHLRNSSLKISGASSITPDRNIQGRPPFHEESNNGLWKQTLAVHALKDPSFIERPCTLFLLNVHVQAILTFPKSTSKGTLSRSDLLFRRTFRSALILKLGSDPKSGW